MKSPNKSKKPKHTTKPRWIKRDNYIIFSRYNRNGRREYTCYIAYNNGESKRRGLFVSLGKLSDLMFYLKRYNPENNVLLLNDK